VRTGTHDTKTLVMADAIAIKNQVSLIKSVSPNVNRSSRSAEARHRGVGTGRTRQSR
jgi:hypothetical protein